MGDVIAPYLDIAAASAGTAVIAAAIQNTLSTTPAALPYEVSAISLGSAGSGATVSGEFALTISGGPPGHTAFITVSGGAITSARIGNRGISTSNSAPTYTLPTIAGLTGATAPTATVSTIAAGRMFYAPTSDGLSLGAWGNNPSKPGLDTAPFGLPQLTLSQDGAAGSGGIYPATAGDGSYVAGITVFSQTAFAQSGVLLGASVYATGAGPATLAIVAVNGDGTVRVVTDSAGNLLTRAVTLSSGANPITNWNPFVSAGQFLAVYAATSIISVLSTAANQAWYTTGLPGTATSGGTAKSATNQARIGWSLSSKFADRIAANSSAINALLASVSTNTLAIASLQTSVTGSLTTSGTYPAVAGSTTSGNGLTIFATAQVSAEGQLTGISVYNPGSSVAATLVVCSDNGDGTVTLQQSKDVTLAANAASSFPDWTPYVGVGYWVGCYCASSFSITTGSTGNTLTYTTGLPGTNTAKATSANILPAISYRVQSGEIARAKAAENKIQDQITGATISGGLYPATALSYNIVGGYTTFSEQAVTKSGRLVSVSCHVNATGPGKIVVATKNGSNQFTLVRATPVTFTNNGVNTFSCFIPVTAGQYVGIYGANAGTSIGALTGSAPRYVAGLPGTNTASTAVANSRTGIGWQIATGISPRQVAAESALDSASDATQALAAEGIGLLSGADSTGTADSTAAFAAARAAHPAPHVPMGTYAVTSLPYNGEGFWGEGKIYVNGVYYPIPRRPADGALRLKARSAMAQCASSNSPKVLIGDSLSAHFYATSMQKHWWQLHAAWINAEEAPDAAPWQGVANSVIRDVTGTGADTAAFYGLTISGTTTAGTNGPLGQSTILADGASITFTGAYAFVDMFYTQQSGAGSLIFSYNGTDYKTVSAAGTTVLDSYTGPSATGQTASGTYSIRASGGPVELTGLIRRPAVLTASGTLGPILHMRQAHGGWQCTNFTTAALTSIIAQAQAISGQGSNAAPEYTVALMTNDMLYHGQATTALGLAQYRTNLTRVLSQLLASNPARAEMLIPPRPDYATFASSVYTATTFDAFVGVATSVCKSLGGLPMLRLDQVNFNAQGLLYPDKIHWTDAGNQLVFETYARWRAEFG
ncbi:hypothetical protein J2X73_002550 [Novosphingobium sp. 1748]|uniref:hypothetical protein n=1 Tax=Novosphingobium sp. 1748 TaxID=2817760 RepID=UPI00285F31DC|nr:hypothetical protein [Novosphingobium sp. 1748]MDR6708179.1 hypothetical protein [Novosphingobium sp. 1748]